MTRFLSRTDIPPLPQDAPIDAIVQWLVREIEIRGHLLHWFAAFRVTQKFGRGYTYKEAVKDGSHGDPHLRGREYQPAPFGNPQRELLHPDILFALKKYTRKNIIWLKDCRGWRLAKGAKLPNVPRASDRIDNDKHDGPTAA